MALGSMGAVRITSWYPNSMDAILACHLALQSDWTEWQNSVNDDVCAQASFTFKTMEVSVK